MNIKGNPGSKERLLEMFQGVNKVSVKESYEDYNTPEGENVPSSHVDQEYSQDEIQAAKLKLKDRTGVDTDNLSQDEFDVMMFDHENSVSEIQEEEDPKKWGDGGSFEDKEGIMQWVEDEEENVASEVGADIESEVSLQNDNIPITGNGNEVHHQIDDAPETGEEFDQIEGGLADDSSVMEFDPLQISKGIEVEMEHTNDPKVALEITMDHLKEIPDYYSRLDSMEQEAETEANPIEMDMGEVPEDLQSHAAMLNNTDKDIENTILGFDVGTPNTPEDKPDENNLTINQ